MKEKCCRLGNFHRLNFLQNFRIIYLNHPVDRFVVFEADVDPLHSLTPVDLLLLLEHHVDEHLLEPLVAVVDAKLLKAIYILQTIAIKNIYEVIARVQLNKMNS